MKIFFIFMIISVYLSIFYLSFYFNSFEEIIEITERKKKYFFIIINFIFPILSLGILISFIVLTFYLSVLLGVLICILFLVPLPVLFSDDFENLIIYIIVTLLFSIIIFWFIPIDKNPQNVNVYEESKQVILLSNPSNDTDNSNVIINISKVDDNTPEYYLYTIMEYNPKDFKNVEIPSTIEMLADFKITKDSDNKLEIITKKIYRYRVLSYFGFTEPNIEYVTSYVLHINESNVISSTTKPD